MISSIIFTILLIGASAFFYINVKKIRRNILLGKNVSFSGSTGDRFKTMMLVAFGQQKMFSRPIPAILHLFLYAAFIITQIELLEIIFDGAAGSHRAFRESLGGFYTFMVSFIEILSVLAFIGTIAFLARRNLLKVPRLVKSELNGWPKLDANIILISEIILICFIFMMNGADEVLYSRSLSHAKDLGEGTLGFSVSSHLGPMLFGGLSDGGLYLIERVGWWGHFLMVLGFLNYLPFSKHLHIVLGFPNTYFSNLKPKGEFTTLESVTDVVAPNFDPAYIQKTDPNNPVRFGVKDVQDLNWKNLMDAYSCTECGRCSAACPANSTGKLLSPRKIMMDTRDRLETVGKNIDANGQFVDDEKSLLNDHITIEELRACTTCNACVEECPVSISPMDIIIELRRSLIMEDSNAPSEWNGMFSNIENNFAPWKFAPDDRDAWTKQS